MRVDGLVDLVQLLRVDVLSSPGSYGALEVSARSFGVVPNGALQADRLQCYHPMRKCCLAARWPRVEAHQSQHIEAAGDPSRRRHERHTVPVCDI